MNNDEYTTRALTQIVAILQVAHRDVLSEARAQIVKDPANQLIFKLTAGWTATADVEKAVVEAKTLSRSALFNRLADLGDRGFLERRKAGNTTEYRNSGLI
jgi:hypothetical protein